MPSSGKETFGCFAQLPIEISLSPAALLASGCWLSIAMLHHGLGNQHIAAAKAETGKCWHIMNFITLYFIDIPFEI